MIIRYVHREPETFFTDHVREDGGEWQLVNEGHNLTTDSFRLLMASLFASRQGYSGAQYWAVGTGDPADDPRNPPAPSVLDTALKNELARVVLTISFVDQLGNTISGGVSRFVQAEAVFPIGFATGVHTEFGLFGGNATATRDSGLLIDRVTHPAIDKHSMMERVLRIRFAF